MNETMESIVKFLKHQIDGASILDVMMGCYLSYEPARRWLERLNSMGVVGLTYRGKKAWFKFVRDL